MWMDLKIITQNESSQTKKKRVLWELHCYKILETETNVGIMTESRFRFAWGWSGERELRRARRKVLEVTDVLLI
jgi:hypothetical protein